MKRGRIRGRRCGSTGRDHGSAGGGQGHAGEAAGGAARGFAHLHRRHSARCPARGTTLGREAERFMAAGAARARRCRDRHRRGSSSRRRTTTGLLVDGFPRPWPQAEALAEMLGKGGEPLDTVVSINVRRTSSSGGSPRGVSAGSAARCSARRRPARAPAGVTLRRRALPARGRSRGDVRARFDVYARDNRTGAAVLSRRGPPAGDLRRRKPRGDILRVLASLP